MKTMDDVMDRVDKLPTVKEQFHELAGYIRKEEDDPEAYMENTRLLAWVKENSMEVINNIQEWEK